MTLGMMRNNPWDLEGRHVPWMGLSPSQPTTGPLMFGTLHDGIRAGFRLCFTYQARGLNTPASFLPEFAPPTENPTAQYLANVCEWTGFAADTLMDFHDQATAFSWARAIWRQEQGAAADIITPAQMLAGYATADCE